MMSQSAVHFATKRRAHIGLAVSSIEQAVLFYQTLFDVGPTKTRPGYARFEITEPPLNLSLIETPQANGPADSVSHFGIQVKSTNAVVEIQNRLESTGLATRTEEAVQCCHAVQDKTWIADPDGHRWEVFVVLDDAPVTRTDESTECCPETQGEPCCTVGGEPCCPEN